MATASAKALEDLTDALARYAHDPLGFVGFAFPWGEGELSDKQPEPWQIKVLADIRNALQAGELTVQEAIQIAVASGHGVGKSALVAWVILWAVSTMVDARVVVTANTETQLSTKTWPELSKWYQLFIAKGFFVFTATSLYSASAANEKTWRADAIPWSVTKSEAFAGLHNQGKRIVLIFDEASGIDDKIWEVSEGALTDKDTEKIWCVFGNRTRTGGRFAGCFKGHQVRIWKTYCVDSREVSFTDKLLIQKWIVTHGEDSDFIRVRVRGLEPKSSTLQFIGSDLIEPARGRHLSESQYSFAPVILTLDPAWTGGDETVIGKRQGLGFTILKAFPKNDDDVKLAGILAQLEDEHKADAVFIDFGYGTGVFSVGKNLGRTSWFLVNSGSSPSDAGFLNKRAEMWNSTKQWLRDGGAIPNDEILCSDLAGPFGYVMEGSKNTGKIFIESKEDMRSRGLPSPNRADALILSFAIPVQKKSALLRNTRQTTRDYDPMAEFNQPDKIPATVQPAYDPMRGL